MEKEVKGASIQAFTKLAMGLQVGWTTMNYVKLGMVRETAQGGMRLGRCLSKDMMEWRLSVTQTFHMISYLVLMLV